MTIEEVVGKVLLDEHADVIREAVRAVAAELMNAHRRDAQRRSATPGFGGEHHRAEACVPRWSDTPARRHFSACQRTHEHITKVIAQPGVRQDARTLRAWPSPTR